MSCSSTDLIGALAVSITIYRASERERERNEAQSGHESQTIET
jgi:hypothetical protein